MKSILGFLLFFSGSVFALDESLNIKHLPVGTRIDFAIPRLEMPPLSTIESICADENTDYGIWINFLSAPQERYFPERKIQTELVKTIEFAQSWDEDIELCSKDYIKKSHQECELIFPTDLKDIYFDISFGEDKSISAFRKFVEGCGGKITLPEPTPYP